VCIDKNTFEKYQAIPDSPLYPIMQERLVRIENDASDLQYAKIKTASDEACPFWDADRLCSIQKEHGAEYLSLTCANYPRPIKTIDNEAERTLLLSCPEAARLVLLHPQLVADETTNAPYPRLPLPATEKLHGETPLIYFWPIRQFVVLLLKDRSYPIWQRLFLLGMFCRRLEELTFAGEIGLIPRLFNEYAEIISTGKLHGTLDTIPPQTAKQLGAILALLVEQQRSSLPRKNQRFRECIQDFARGIQYQSGLTALDLTPHYAEAYTRYYLPWAEQQGSLLENYLLNYVFGHLFPFSSPGPEQGMHAYREFLILCCNYVLIKGLLVGMAGHYRSSFDTTHAIKLIQSFVKAFEHNPLHVEQMMSLLERNRMNHINGIAALLRDVVPESPAGAAPA
jgi:lysine-N-methylase